MMEQYFDSMVTGLEAKLAAEPQNPNPRKRYALHVARLGKQLYTHENRVAWCGVAAPFDLLSAMGVTSCFVEFIGAMLASSGMINPFLEKAEHEGYASDTCGYHRAVMGATSEGLMPEPDFLIATTCPCSGGLAILENLAQHFKKDLFLVHIPQEYTDRNVRYLADQFKDMTTFVTEHTGQKLDANALRETFEKTNKARELMIEVYDLAQQVPSPASNRDLGNFAIVTALFLGTDAAIEIAQAFRDEFTARVKAGTSGVPGEQSRLMWIQNRIQFKNPLLDMFENDHKAAIVIDELNHMTWDPIDLEDPYTSMAKRAITNPFNGTSERRISLLKKLAQTYKIDGAINPCHWGCRQGTGVRGAVEEGLKDIGVPVLNLEVDCVDKRNFAEGQLKTRLEAFLEMLNHNPRRT